MQKLVQIIDDDSGEIIDSKSFPIIPKSVRYVRVTTDALELPMSSIKAGIFIATVVASEDNCFVLDSEFKTKFLAAMGVKEARYFQVLQELKEKGVIVKVRGREYMLNPNLFFRCVSRVRDKLVKYYDRMVYRMQYASRLKEIVSDTQYEIPSR